MAAPPVEQFPVLEELVNVNELTIVKLKRRIDSVSFSDEQLEAGRSGYLAQETPTIRKEEFMALQSYGFANYPQYFAALADVKCHAVKRTLPIPIVELWTSLCGGLDSKQRILFKHEIILPLRHFCNNMDRILPEYATHPSLKLAATALLHASTQLGAMQLYNKKFLPNQRNRISKKSPLFSFGSNGEGKPNYYPAVTIYNYCMLLVDTSMRALGFTTAQRELFHLLSRPYISDFHKDSCTLPEPFGPYKVHMRIPPEADRLAAIAMQMNVEDPLPVAPAPNAMPDPHNEDLLPEVEEQQQQQQQEQQQEQQQQEQQKEEEEDEEEEEGEDEQRKSSRRTTGSSAAARKKRKRQNVAEEEHANRLSNRSNKRPKN